MNSSNMFSALFSGLGVNLFITAITFCVVIHFGVLFSILASINKTVGKVFEWISLPFECLSLPIVLILFYYGPALVFGANATDRMTAVLIAFSVCYLGYMPSRYNYNFTCIKNILYNGLGLISNLLKWSVVARMIAVYEISWAGQEYIKIDGDISGVVFSLIIIFVLVAVIEIARKCIKHGMKNVEQ